MEQHLHTSDPHVFAAGDLARWPDAHGGGSMRVEHWVFAERQGQTAARNMMRRRESLDAVPFFWSAHYDVSILDVDHAETWDVIEIDGRVDEKDCRATYRHDGRVVAVATIGQDLESLRAERASSRTFGADTDVWGAHDSGLHRFVSSGGWGQFGTGMLNCFAGTVGAGRNDLCTGRAGSCDVHDIRTALERSAYVEGFGWMPFYVRRHLAFTDKADPGADCLLPRFF